MIHQFWSGLILRLTYFRVNWVWDQVIFSSRRWFISWYFSDFWGTKIYAIFGLNSIPVLSFNSWEEMNVSRLSVKITTLVNPKFRFNWWHFFDNACSYYFKYFIYATFCGKFDRIFSNFPEIFFLIWVLNRGGFEMEYFWNPETRDFLNFFPKKLQSSGFCVILMNVQVIRAANYVDM